MNYKILLFNCCLLLTYICHGQITTTPNSITIGFESAEIEDDTLFLWNKSKGYMRSGLFDATSSNFAEVGDFSHSFGIQNIAFGESSFATNEVNLAFGRASAAFGSSNEARGEFSAVFGSNNVARYPYETVVGLYSNDVVAGAGQPLFVVGNGNSNATSDAFMVTASDGVAIGNIYPDADLHIEHGNNGQKDGLKLENESTGNHWRLFAGGNIDQLALWHHSVGNMPIGVFDPSGTYAAPSDRRLKTDIEKLPYGLSTVMQLQPKRYRFRHMPETSSSLGLIAQDVIKIAPELVNYNTDKDQYHMNYDGFSVIAIQAIKELKELVDEQRDELVFMKNQLNLLKEKD